MASETSPSPDGRPETKPTSMPALVIAWTLTCAPLAWGVYMTALGVLKLFHS